MTMITEQDRLSYDLAKKVPDMKRGFTIWTSYGDLYVVDEDAQLFAELAERLLKKKLADLQGGSEHGRH
jgi:hypothetical protein